MCRFSNMDSRSRSTLSRCLSLVFVLSVFVHGLVLVATAIWMAVVNVTKCSFLQKYYVPIFLQLTAGLCALSLSSVSIVFTATQRTASFIRLFLFGIMLVILLELATVISSEVLKNSQKDLLKTEMLSNLMETLNSSSDDGNEIECWEDLQKSRQCCGAWSYRDWCPGVATYADCTSNGSVTILHSCECETSCVTWDTKPLHAASCYDSLSEQLYVVYKLCQILGTVLLVLQLVTYWALYCILPKLHSKAIVDTYKPKPTFAESGL